MTSGKFDIVPVDSILVHRERRQRRELEDIEGLAESIRQHGLINPIVVTREFELIAGERRLTAHQHLGFQMIAVQFADELSETEKHLIELEENVRRVDLSWQDHVNAVALYHRMRSEAEPDWSAEKSAESLGLSATHLRRHLVVKEAMDEGVPEVREAPKFSTAFGFAERRAERRKTAAKRDLLADLATVPATAPTAPENGPTAPNSAPSATPSRPVTILNTDFINWSKNILDEPYNFLHVDFPYGVNAGDTRGQSAAKSFGGYADKPETYFNLCEAFVNNLDNFCAPSAHLMFWFSMDYYAETYEMLRSAGWRIDPFPLIWYKSDNTGILPDSNRGPRRVYETAFFGSRGDRKVVRAVGNCVGAGTPPKLEKIHMSQKARPMLEHFFRMIVDESTRMLDPTCGSGEAIGVAEAFGASVSLGIELNEDFALDARARLGL